MTGRSRRRGPMTRIATGSSSARAPAASFSKPMNTPRREAPASMPNSSVMACPATPITSRRRSRAATAAYRAMASAIKRAGISPGEIDYINAHGTSTPLGDEIELQAVQRLVGDAVGCPVRCRRRNRRSDIFSARPAPSRRFLQFSPSATKSSPPTLNLDNVSMDTRIDLVPHKARKRNVEFVLSNSFGFGGTNACLIFKRAE